MGPRSNNSLRSRPDTVRGADKEDEPHETTYPCVALRGHDAVRVGGCADGRGCGIRAGGAREETRGQRSQSAGRDRVANPGSRNPDAHGGVLAGTQSFSVSVRGDYDAVQTSGQKIEFGENRTVTLSRPDR